MAPGYKQQRIEIRVDPFALLLVAFICQYNSETVNDSVKGCLRRVSFCLDLPHHLTGGNPRCRMGSPAVRVFNPVRACRAVILSLVAIAAVAACVVPSTTTVAEPTKGSDEAAPGLVTATVTVIDASSATPAATARKSIQVAHTDGDGVSVRRTPRLDDGVADWPDGTRLEDLGEHVASDGLVWLKVRDPSGAVGYVPARYLAPLGWVPSPTAMIQSTPTIPPAISTATTSPKPMPTVASIARPMTAQVVKPVAAPRSGELRRVTVTRIGKDQYRADDGTIFLTRLCLELALSDEAIYDGVRGELRFSHERCDVTEVIAPTTASIGSSSNAFESRIAGEFKGWEGDTVFPLQNGQVWQQASYAYTYHYAYAPRVLIYGTAQGWRMQVDGVRGNIAVRRIR